MEAKIKINLYLDTYISLKKTRNELLNFIYKSEDIFNKFGKEKETNKGIQIYLNRIISSIYNISEDVYCLSQEFSEKKYYDVQPEDLNRISSIDVKNLFSKKEIEMNRKILNLSKNIKELIEHNRIHYGIRDEKIKQEFKKIIMNF